MDSPSYWLTIFTAATWQEFLEAGAETAGFPERRWQTVKQIREGDYLLCYITGVSRWIGVLEVISSPFVNETPIWKENKFPCRVKVKVVIELALEKAIPVLELKEKLTVFQKLSNPKIWSMAFRTAPSRWQKSDGEIVVDAIKTASTSSSSP